MRRHHRYRDTRSCAVQAVVKQRGLAAQESVYISDNTFLLHLEKISLILQPFTVIIGITVKNECQEAILHSQRVTKFTVLSLRRMRQLAPLIAIVFSCLEI